MDTQLKIVETNNYNLSWSLFILKKLSEGEANIVKQDRFLFYMVMIVTVTFLGAVKIYQLKKLMNH